MAIMSTAAGVRISWYDLPLQVQTAAESILTSPVITATSQPGGFSPGTADRVVTAAGRRAFIKAVHPQLNDRTPALHRREAAVTAQLPPDPRIPALLGSYDDGDWIVLVFEDVDGRHPATPWLPAELEAVLETLTSLSRRMTPAPVPFLRTAADALGEDLAGWTRLWHDPPAALDPWAGDRLDLLAELGERAQAALDGDSLVHSDVRADNLLIREDGSVVVIDWPWACTGPAWLDPLMLLVNVNLFGGHDVDALLARWVDVDPDVATEVLAGLAGYFTDAARRPAPVGLPTLRQFQAEQGAATLAWLRDRLP